MSLNLKNISQEDFSFENLLHLLWQFSYSKFRFRKKIFLILSVTTAHAKLNIGNGKSLSELSLKPKPAADFNTE